MQRGSQKDMITFPSCEPGDSLMSSIAHQVPDCPRLTRPASVHFKVHDIESKSRVCATLDTYFPCTCDDWLTTRVHGMQVSMSEHLAPMVSSLISKKLGKEAGECADAEVLEAFSTVFQCYVMVHAVGGDAQKPLLVKPAHTLFGTRCFMLGVDPSAISAGRGKWVSLVSARQVGVDFSGILGYALCTSMSPGARRSILGYPQGSMGVNAYD